ncbi:hypothetical protein [Jannaschia sp. R86511]|uniref:hypothetical protein n=1 Tax=Jannaschia sp. R86511 TaxID=3093853 RepID=UPI0036D26A06
MFDDEADAGVAVNGEAALESDLSTDTGRRSGRRIKASPALAPYGAATGGLIQLSDTDGTTTCGGDATRAMAGAAVTSDRLAVLPLESPGAVTRTG